MNPDLLAQLLADPGRVAEIPAEQARALLLQLAPLQEALRLQALQPSADGKPEVPGEDRLLTVEEVARRLGVSKDAVYRGKWPFEVRPVGRSRRFSAQGLDRFIRQRMGR